MHPIGSGSCPRPWLFLLPLLLAVLAYANSLGSGFVWDDTDLIVQNELLGSHSQVWRVFTQDFFQSSPDRQPYGYFRPVTTLSYILDHQVWGLRPSGFHLTNLLLHGAATVLAVALALRFGLGSWVALLAGALFAVHPIHTENVAWISGRTDVLAFVFCGLAMLLHLRARAPTAERGPCCRGFRGRIALTAASLVCFTLGLLSKEVGLVFVIWLFLFHVLTPGRQVAGVLRILSPYILVAGMVVAGRFVLAGVTLPDLPEGVSPLDALMTLPFAILRYVLWLVLPVDLSAYVKTPYVTSLSDWRLVLGLLAGLAGAFAWPWAWRAHRAVAVMACMVVAAFFPVSNLVRLAGPPDMGFVMAERFAYWASFPFCLLVAWGSWKVYSDITRTRVWKGAGIVGAVVCLTACFGLTVARNRDWKDELTFLTSTLRRSAGAPLLSNRLAMYWIRQGDLEKAASALAEAVRLDADSVVTRRTRILLLANTGRAREAVRLAEELMGQVKGANRSVELTNFAYVLRRAGDYSRAEQVLLELVQSGHASYDVHANLGELWRTTGQLDKARESFMAALRLRPDDRDVEDRLGVVALQSGTFADAESIYRRLSARYPENPAYGNNLGLTLTAQGRAEEAEPILLAVLGRHPFYLRARLTLSEAYRALGRREDEREQLLLVARDSTEPGMADTATRRLQRPWDGRGPASP